MEQRVLERAPGAYASPAKRQRKALNWRRRRYYLFFRGEEKPLRLLHQARRSHAPYFCHEE